MYVIIEFGVRADYDKEDKDKLAASICYRNTAIDINKNPEIDDKLFNPMRDAFKRAIGNNSHNSAGANFSMLSGRADSIGFMAKGWPKLKQLLNALGIKFEIDKKLKRMKNQDLTPGGAKILGI